MLNKLTKLANELDKLGYYEQADAIDEILKKIASDEEKVSFLTTDKEKVQLFDTEKRMIHDLYELSNDALIFWWHFAKSGLSDGLPIGWKKDELQYFFNRLNKLREIKNMERLKKKVPANEYVENA